MAFSYTSKSGDTIDYIAWLHYGRQDGKIVEKLLDANNGLADQNPILPAGVRIRLPDIQEPARENGVRLWD